MYNPSSLDARQPHLGHALSEVAHKRIKLTSVDLHGARLIDANSTASYPQVCCFVTTNTQP
jgi:hypothetical protein